MFASIHCLVIVCASNPHTVMVKAKIFKLAKYFEGNPKPTDLELVEEELPALQNGEFLLEAVYLSVDPYMRAYNPRLKIGDTYIGSQVAKVIDSKNPKYPVGTHIVANIGWRSHTILDNLEAVRGYIWPNKHNLPLSYTLGVLGMPGNTAYFGFLEICEPKEGETVVVSGAAGAVGSLVGQIAKIKGCRVIGIAGSDEKGQWLVKDLGFDGFINYKTQDIEQELKKLAPNGVDCYFDNVSGETTYIVLNQMNDRGRVSVCGAISGYNAVGDHKVTNMQRPMIFHQIKMEGFIVWRWTSRWMEGLDQLAKWIVEGKLKTRETETVGFENMFTAFVEMLEGKTTGKAVVKA